MSDTEMGSDPIHFHHGCASATHGDDEAPLKENKKPGKKSGKRSSANLVFVITSTILTYFYIKEPPFYYI